MENLRKDNVFMIFNYLNLITHFNKEQVTEERSANSFWEMYDYQEKAQLEQSAMYWVGSMQLKPLSSWIGHWQAPLLPDRMWQEPLLVLHHCPTPCSDI